MCVCSYIYITRPRGLISWEVTQEGVNVYTPTCSHPCWDIFSQDTSPPLPNGPDVHGTVSPAHGQIPKRPTR